MSVNICEFGLCLAVFKWWWWSSSSFDICSCVVAMMLSRRLDESFWFCLERVRIEFCAARPNGFYW